MTNKERAEIQQKVVDCVKPGESGRLLLSPRYGKSKIIIDIIKRDKPNSILWVTPSRKLADIDIPEEFDKWKAKRFKSKLTTTTWSSLNKYDPIKYDLVILDEEQYATDNNLSVFTAYKDTYEISPCRILSMTGTPTEHDTKKDLYKKLNLNVLYSVSINDAVEEGVLANYQINVVEIQLSSDKNVEVKTKDKSFTTSEFAQYQFLDKMAKQAMFQKRKDTTFRIMNRVRAIKDSPSKLKVADKLITTLTGRNLFFCGSIKQAESLTDSVFHSKTDDTFYNKFKEGEVDVLAMVNSGGTGHTYKEIDNLVLVQCDSDKNGSTSQKISRTLLKQGDYKATIWILCLMGTQDEKWVASTLSKFDESKINYVNVKNL